MSTLSRTLAHFGRPSEAAVASALLFLSTAVPPESTTVDSHTMFQLFALFCGDSDSSSMDPIVQQSMAASNPASSEWRVDVLVQAVTAVASQFNSPLDWRLVIHSLDVDGLQTQLTQAAFVEIAKAYVAGTGGTLLPADCLLDNWHHAPAQLCIVSHALASPEYINWEVLELFDGATPEDVASPYARVALIEKLVELDARDLLQNAIKGKADVVLLSLTCAKPQCNTALQQKLTVTLLAPLIALFPASEKPLRQMWNVTPALVEAGIINMWKKDPSTLRKALSISIDMGILPDLLASGSSLEFSLELAILAYREDVLQFETWLSDMLSARGIQSVSILTIYIAQKVRITDPLAATNFSLNALRILFRCLITNVRRSGGSQTQDLLEGVQEVYETYCRIDSRMSDLSPTGDVDPKILFGSEVSHPAVPNNVTQPMMSSTDREPSDGASEAASTAAAMLLPPPSSDGTAASFPSQIEKEADIFFGRLYQGEMQTEEAVDILRHLRASTLEKERHIFNCTMHTLFDEYRFFKKYPDRELKITGMLFGSVVQNGLFEGGLLGLAAKCVLDALITVEPAPQPTGRLAKFGLCALERFRSRLHEWPQYCSQILEIPRLKELAPELIGGVQSALDMNGAIMPSAAEKKIGLAVAESDVPNEPVLTTEEGVPPASSVRDAAADADAVRALVASPPLSTSNTPMKGRSVSSTSLRSSPPLGGDGSLGMSPLDITSLLGMTPEEASQVVAPDEATQDKMKFIFNNLSQNMMDEKVEEMLSILKPEHYRYFSVYIVVKRASSEANFHHLYLAMLEKMQPQVPSLFSMVFQATYRRVKVLLLGDKSKASADRTILKSLGSWIGSLTLARNRPILRRDLDLKQALLEAYSNGRLTIVIPFVAKVLEACRESKIFKPSNPWVRGVLSLMKEVYAVEGLKLNMKFELQILSKHLNIDVSTIVQSELLRNRKAPEKVDNQDFTSKKAISSPPPRTSPSPAASPSPELRRTFVPAAVGARSGTPMFSLSDVHASSAPLSIPISTGSMVSVGRLEMPPSLVSNNLAALGPDPVADLSSILASTSISTGGLASTQAQRSSLHASGSMGVGSVHAASSSHRHGTNVPSGDTVIPNLAQYITVSPSLVLLQSYPNLKRMIPLAIDRAIREIIQPVVERSCAIAFLTTKELTLKDFANEPDLSKVRRAALQMVQQLAGSLALVTSKEPLRVSMGNQLRTVFTTTGVVDQNLVEQTAQVLSAANLDVGCSIIEKHAKEKAARDLNEKIGAAFASRRPQPSSYAMGLAPGPEVLRVYDEFSRIHRGAGPAPQYSTASNVPTTSQPIPQPQMSPPTSSPPSISILSQAPSRSAQLTMDQRPNGSAFELKPDSRLLTTQPPPRTSPQYRTDASSQSVIVGRRISSAASKGLDAAPQIAAYGSALPKIAAPSQISDFVLAAASATSSHGGTAGSSSTSALASEEEALSTQQVLERFHALYPQLTGSISEFLSSSGSEDVALSDVPSDHEIHTLWIQIPLAVKKSVTADEAGMAVAQKVFKRLYEGDSNLYREVHVLLLEGLRESCRRLSKELGSWLAFSEDRKKLHKECIIALLKPGSLLNKTSYDEVLAKAIDNGRNVSALEFAGFLVNRAVIDEPLATAAEFYLTLEAMAKVARRPDPPVVSSAPDGLQTLVGNARSVEHKPVPPVSSSTVIGDLHHASSRQSKDAETTDPSGTRDSIAQVLVDWHRILVGEGSNRPHTDQIVTGFLGQLRISHLNSDEGRERFFRVTVEIASCVTTAALGSHIGDAQVPSDLSESPYTVAETTIRLIGALSRLDSGLTSDGNSRGVDEIVQFLSALSKDLHTKSGIGSDLRAHFRLFSGLINELAIGATVKDQSVNDAVAAEPDHVSNSCAEHLRSIVGKDEALNFLDDKSSGLSLCVRNAGANVRGNAPANLDNYQVLVAITGALSACSPSLIPGFAFSWLHLISSKDLLPSLLSLSNVQGWPLFRHLLITMLEFLSEFLTDAKEPLPEGIRVLYSGMLRVLLVLLHDFPEFLCAYHMSFCDAIPQNCVQLRNLVLASFPKDMRLPDPFLPELNIDDLPDMARQPLILSDYLARLESSGIRAVVDNFMQRGSSQREIIPQLKLEKYLAKDGGDGKIFDVPLFGALVLYLGQIALSRTPQGEPPVIHGSATDVIRSLTRELGPEGQHYLFNAIANQLRYPNSNTMYFSNVLLLLFREAAQDSVKEQITRVLVERLIANRPHPWGLLITFVQLIKNKEFNFWGHGFVRCAPEIEQLFENVAKFCVGPVLQSKQQSLVMAS